MNSKRKTLLLTALVSVFVFGAPTANAQQLPTVQIPIVLMQQLPKAPRIVKTTANYDISVVCDTANYIAVVTHGTIDEADSLQFPAGKLILSENQSDLTLTFGSEFPYRSNIQLHTTARNMSLHAMGSSQITLTSADKQEINLDAIVLQTEGNAIITVEQDLTAKQTYINAKDYSVVRHNAIHADKSKRDIYGGARIVEIGKEVEESPLAVLYRHTGEEGAFIDLSGGVSYLASRPFGGENTSTGNIVWGTGFHYSFAGRIATWQRPHWGLSTGLGFKMEVYRADNAFLDLIVDTVSGFTSLQAVDATNLFGPRNSNILWSSTMYNMQLFIPIHVEWRNRTDYRGLRIGAELRPGITYLHKYSYLNRTGFCQGENKVVESKNENLGKYINRFQLGAKFVVSYDKLSFFVESTLTPLFRSRTGGANARPALDQKIYPYSVGFTVTL